MNSQIRMGINSQERLDSGVQNKSGSYSQGGEGMERNHKLTLCGRKRLELTGVKDVGTFDDTEISLLTDVGKMQIRGEQLHVAKLDLGTGEVFVDGRVDSILYLNKGVRPGGGTSLLRSIFR